MWFRDETFIISDYGSNPEAIHVWYLRMRSILTRIILLFTVEHGCKKNPPSKTLSHPLI